MWSFKATIISLKILCNRNNSKTGWAQTLIWILMKQEVMGWPWHQQTICTSLQTDNHASTSSLNFLQAGCSSWCPTYRGWHQKGKPFWILLEKELDQHANHLHLAPDRRQYLTTQSLQDGCPSCGRTNSVEALMVGWSLTSQIRDEGIL